MRQTRSVVLDHSGLLVAGTWIVLAAILLGKPIGIVAAIGFTVALCFAAAAFPAGDLLDQTKKGALLSFSSAIVAGIAAFLLRVGRMAHA